jgi:hypothetical protein
MAASTITIKLNPAEYATLKAELTDQLENVTLARKGSTGLAAQKYGQREGKLSQLISQL